MAQYLPTAPVTAPLPDPAETAPQVPTVDTTASAPQQSVDLRRDLSFFEKIEEKVIDGITGHITFNQGVEAARKGILAGALIGLPLVFGGTPAVMGAYAFYKSVRAIPQLPTFARSAYAAYQNKTLMQFLGYAGLGAATVKLGTAVLSHSLLPFFLGAELAVSSFTDRATKVVLNEGDKPNNVLRNMMAAQLGISAYSVVNTASNLYKAGNSVLSGLSALFTGEPKADLNLSPETQKVVDKLENAGFTVESVDGDSVVLKSEVTKLPLYNVDWYDGKLHNAGIAADQINQIHPMAPGEHIALIEDGILTFKEEAGYTHVELKDSPDKMLAGGTCYAITELGKLQNNVNSSLQNAGIVNLFEFRDGSDINNNIPHEHYYRTYEGHGYTVLTDDYGNIITDYKFGINPEFKADGFDIRVSTHLEKFGSGRYGDNGNSMEGYVSIELIAEDGTSITDTDIIIAELNRRVNEQASVTK